MTVLFLLTEQLVAENVKATTLAALRSGGGGEHGEGLAWKMGVIPSQVHLKAFVYAFKFRVL